MIELFFFFFFYCMSTKKISFTVLVLCYGFYRPGPGDWSWLKEGRGGPKSWVKQGCFICGSLCLYIFISSVHFSPSVVSDSLRPHESQHTRPPCPSSTPGVHPDSRTSSQWRHPAISSSVVPFSSCPQSLPASEPFPMSQLFAWGGQNTGVSALASFLPKKSQGWSPSECTGWISLLSKGLSRVFSNTTVQKHQLFGTQLSSQTSLIIYSMAIPTSHHPLLPSSPLAHTCFFLANLICSGQ